MWVLNVATQLIVNSNVEAACTEAAAKIAEAVPQGIPRGTEFQLHRGIAEEHYARLDPAGNTQREIFAKLRVVVIQLRAKSNPGAKVRRNRPRLDVVTATDKECLVNLPALAEHHIRVVQHSNGGMVRHLENPRVVDHECR